MHLRLWDVAKEVPIGDLSLAKSQPISDIESSPVEVEFPEAEKEAFDLWLRQLWRDKDQAIGRFVETGRFDGAGKMQRPLEIPLVLKHRREIFNAFAFFLPAIIWTLWAKFK